VPVDVRRSSMYIICMSDREHTAELMLDFGPDGTNLVPVVTQDMSSREVLILAFVNREAFEETRKTGFAVYFSRSRNTLWRKGETSGNRLAIREIRINCEQNSLVFLVDQTGDGACHVLREDGTHYRGCYYRRIEPSGILEAVDG